MMPNNSMITKQGVQHALPNCFFDQNGVWSKLVTVAGLVTMAGGLVLGADQLIKNTDGLLMKIRK